ncbi:MarR family winged helix-turn-helix transcriptional regulator [Actinomycetospora sp. NBRC 106378]|uniref:MarR family winged helix-turn-helix transcriptional regulator n=1 Tax=Actinomycetospora sp. NBRC 106378 TaxID=3032208 RepID=UPI0024A43A2E|nr:MarR family winged helix-turn-helix transcriptional regulator [Actinomycetospora sp. NBRC 106378]GLZ55894.1 hypothetical protein Acsp07_55110 [Actinomycetospora sp. NBRC 106378]
MSDDALPVWNLMRTAHVVGLRFAQVFATTDLTPTQFGVLHALAERELTQAKLARVVLVRPQSIGVLVADMVDRGLVERHGPGGRGRRATLGLTTDGRETLDRAWPAVREFNAPSALGLTAAQAAMLEEILDRVRETLTSGD